MVRREKGSWKVRAVCYVGRLFKSSSRLVPVPGRAAMLELKKSSASTERDLCIGISSDSFLLLASVRGRR